MMDTYLAHVDPVVFEGLRDGNYKIVRMLDGRSDIVDNTSFRDEILLTKNTFSLFANTFGSFRDYETQFETLAHQGAHLRFILTDFSRDNEANWSSYNTATENVASARLEVLANASNIRELIQQLHKKYPGLIELRFSRKPLFYTLWVRDPDLPTGMAHLGITYYGHKTNWPAIRVSSKTGGHQLEAMSQQFELLWGEAIPDTGQIWG